MKILIDMNLTPRWVVFLSQHGHDAVHWSTVGSPDAPDTEIMSWARKNDAIVFTNDLDFSVLLALTYALGPSVLQVRSQDLLPEAIGSHVLQVLADHEAELLDGAIITIDAITARVRILPVIKHP